MSCGAKLTIFLCLQTETRERLVSILACKCKMAAATDLHRRHAEPRLRAWAEGAGVLLLLAVALGRLEPEGVLSLSGEGMGAWLPELISEAVCAEQE